MIIFDSLTIFQLQTQGVYPYCHLQFDTVQKMMVSGNGTDPLASVLYPQLLGLCMGIDENTLGIGMNQLDIGGVASFLESGEENAE